MAVPTPEIERLMADCIGASSFEEEDRIVRALLSRKDFTREDASALARGLRAKGQELMRRAEDLKACADLRDLALCTPGERN